MSVVHEGALPKFQLLLASPHIQVAEQAVWALGNIAGDSATTRDMVLESGVLNDLLRLIKPDTSISLLRNIVWAISNLCRNKNPPPNFELVRGALPTLAKFLHYNDRDVLADTCWALSYLTDGSNDKIQEVLDTGLCGRLVELLGHEDLMVLTPALRAVGNIVTGNDMQVRSFDVQLQDWAENLISLNKTGKICNKSVKKSQPHHFYELCFLCKLYIFFLFPKENKKNWN